MGIRTLGHASAVHLPRVQEMLRSAARNCGGNVTVKTYSMDDVGTRAEHLADVQDIWSTALSILTIGTYHSTDEKRQAQELEVALKLLENHMTYNYDQIVYAKVINALPQKAEEIKDDKEKS